MRILHICQRDDPDIGGSLRVVEALVREQRAAGLDVWVLFLYGGAGHISALFAPNAVHLGIASSKQAPAGMVRLRQAVKRLAPDLIHSHDGILWPRLAYASLSVPVITHTHLPPPVSSGFKGRLAWPLIKRTTAAACAISRHTQETWTAAGFPSDRIHLVPNGVDFSRFPPADAAEKKRLRKELGLPADRRMVLWVGRLHQAMKGTDRIEYAASRLPDDVVLVVVGNGPEYDGMKSRMQALIDAGRVVLAGSAADPAAYYRAADGYLFTSHFEPFGLVILEAVAAGLPILAFPVSRGGGATALLKEFQAEAVADGASPEAVAASVERMLGRREDAVKIRSAAEVKYSWKAAADLVMDVYNKVLSAGAAEHG